MIMKGKLYFEDVTFKRLRQSERYIFFYFTCNTLCMGPDPEYLVYTQPNVKSMVDRLSFFKPRTPNLL